MFSFKANLFLSVLFSTLLLGFNTYGVGSAAKSIDGDTALQTLLEGNARFVSGNVLHKHHDESRRALLGGSFCNPCGWQFGGEAGDGEH